MYKKRKLERATDSIVFKILEPVLAGLITFFGMTVMGMWFISMHDSDENVNIYGNIGYAVGTVLFFIISYIIIRKSTKIFTKSTFKAFIAYSIITAQRRLMRSSLADSVHMALIQVRDVSMLEEIGRAHV